jgi:hypothetical protein
MSIAAAVLALLFVIEATTAVLYVVWMAGLPL